MKDETSLPAPVVELAGIRKSYGRQEVLHGVDLAVRPGHVTCVLGDNGAGKSTLIKILAGAHRPTEGEILLHGETTVFHSPREAQERGISTVFQTLGLVDLMSVWRNFFLGAELRRHGLLAVADMRRITREEMNAMGVPIDDVDRLVGTLSGGQRQCVAIARAAYRGAEVLVLDEPTAALGVRQARLVLTLIRAAASRGAGVVLVTHNPSHAYRVGDEFLILNGGRAVLQARRGEVSESQLMTLMAGSEE